MTEKTTEQPCCGGSGAKKLEVETTDSEEKARRSIRKQYGNIASEKTQFSNEKEDDSKIKKGSPFYSKEELESIPKEAHLGLGSGNPIALANIKKGETIIDLGSGGGIDCFLAANKTGKNGKVIGVDMTPEMIDLARTNALKGNYSNIEFRLGEIEHLPIANNEADLIVSNCVINLASSKEQVFREAYRVLKPGGRVLISDIMFAKQLPEKVNKAFKGMASCVARAVLVEEYKEIIEKTGFVNVEIIDQYVIQRTKQKSKQSKPNDKNKIRLNSDGKVVEIELTPEEIKQLDNAILSAHIIGFKPI